MQRLLVFFRSIGSVLFLGTIITYAMISGLMTDQSIESIAFGRTIVSTGSMYLTQSGMWLMAAAGALLCIIEGGFRKTMNKVQLVVYGLIVLNTYLFILPAAASATTIAAQSIPGGQLLPEYNAAYMTESISGAVNVIAMLWLLFAWSRRNNE